MHAAGGWAAWWAAWRAPWSAARQARLGDRALGEDGLPLGPLRGFDFASGGSLALAGQALALWRAQPVAAVISDRHMPGIDGPALLQRIAEEAQAAGQGMPCRILCTGSPDSAAAIGVDAVLQKPVTLAALHRVLRASGVEAAAEAVR